MTMDILVTMAALAVAGFAKGIVGLGLPPIAMGLLVLSMTPVEAAAIMVVPALITNVLQALGGRNLRALLRRFWPTLVLTALATVAFAGALSRHADAAITVLGVLLALYALYSLKTPEFTLTSRQERWLGPLSGTVTGIVTAFTGVSSMPSVPFLQSVGLDRDAFVQAMGISFSVSALALALALGATGGLSAVPVIGILAATGSALAAMWGGLLLRKRLDQATFRRVFLIALLALGIYLALR